MNAQGQLGNDSHAQIARVLNNSGLTARDVCKSSNQTTIRTVSNTKGETSISSSMPFGEDKNRRFINHGSVRDHEKLADSRALHGAFKDPLQRII
jgi:hypothetical protein